MALSTELNHSRQQLTLFVKGETETIEQIRKEFNPVQYQLIPAHVTLCREDEISSIENVIRNIAQIRLASSLRISFDVVERFENGKGVLFPGSENNSSFHALRKSILKGVISTPRLLQPHITLMHPRNSTCTDSQFEEIKKYKLPSELYFDTINLIEQKNGGKWAIVDEFKITD